MNFFFFPAKWSSNLLPSAINFIIKQAFNDTALDAKKVQEWVLLRDPSLKIGGYGTLKNI